MGTEVRGDGAADEPSLAVVVPVWQEAEVLPMLLQSLQQQTKPPRRIVVADGGSTDGTAAVALQWGAEVVACTRRGRGCQIAQALPRCWEDIIVIAHADMIFPPLALARIADWLHRHPDCVGGCLGHRFDQDGWIYRLIEWADRRRAQRGLAYGDQAQFFRRSVLERIGGFPPWPLFEDVALSQRLRQAGTVVYLDVPVTVSVRRFRRRGLLRTLWQNWWLRRRFAQEGESAVEVLYRRYYGESPPRS